MEFVDRADARPEPIPLARCRELLGEDAEASTDEEVSRFAAILPQTERQEDTSWIRQSSEHEIWRLRGPACPFVVRDLAMRCAIVNGVPIVGQGSFSRAVLFRVSSIWRQTVQLLCWTGIQKRFSRQSS